MSDNLPTIDRPRHRHRVQFTIRTFFGAAFLVSLFGAAAALPTTATKVSAIAFLVWLTVAGLYWLVDGKGPLVALPVGAMVSFICWSIALLFDTPDDIRRDGRWWIAVPVALAWGVVLSIIVVLSRILGYAGRWLRGRLWRGFASQSTSYQEVMPALSATAVAGQILIARLALSGILAVGGNLILWYPLWESESLASVSLLIDLPCIPIVIAFCPSPPKSSLLFILITAVLFCPLYAATGWLIGYVLLRIGRRAALTGVAAATTAVAGEARQTTEDPERLTTGAPPPTPSESALPSMPSRAWRQDA